MSYYVSAQTSSRSALAVGPFRRHGDALAMVDRVRVAAGALCRDVDGFEAWGTCRHTTSHRRLGRLNTALGVALDDDGFVTVTP